MLTVQGIVEEETAGQGEGPWEGGPVLGQVQGQILCPKNETMPFPQPIKICSLGRKLEMLPGGRGAGMKMSTTLVSKHLWGLREALGGHLQEP